MLGPVEIAVLGGAALLLFGPEQFPKVARKAGSFVRDMQTTSQSFIREMERAADLNESPPAPHASDLIATGSGEGPKAHEPLVTAPSYDDADLPGMHVADDANVWGYEPPVVEPPAPAPPLGIGAAIDPSATLILTADGDVRHAVAVASESLEPVA